MPFFPASNPTRPGVSILVENHDGLTCHVETLDPREALWLAQEIREAALSELAFAGIVERL